LDIILAGSLQSPKNNYKGINSLLPVVRISDVKSRVPSKYV
jgi:hypothetical protein